MKLLPLVVALAFSLIIIAMGLISVSPPETGSADGSGGGEQGEEKKIAVERPHPGYTEGPATRDGIGKFYLGREIAFVMGHQAIGWLERENREDEERPSLLIKNLELKPGDKIADIGAGSGYFTFRMAPLVESGAVYAVDIQQEMIDYLIAKSRETEVDNVVPILGEVDDTKLPENTLDVALMVDAYHEFSHPFEMMTSIFKALRSGGKVFLLEYRGEDITVPIKPLHKMTQAQAKKEMAAVGLRWVETRDLLPWQHFMVFEKP
ncbi:MAG: class I SAM-dependent methyltransferase [Verrucomicrobiota bacterium]